MASACMTLTPSSQLAPLARRSIASSPCRRISILEGWCGTNLDDVVGAFSVAGMLAASDIATASGFNSCSREDGASSGILVSSKTTALAAFRISGAVVGGGFALALAGLPFARTSGKGEVDPAGIADQLAAQFD